MEEKKKRGGARVGAGRPVKPETVRMKQLFFSWRAYTIKSNGGEVIFRKKVYKLVKKHLKP